MLFKQFKVPGLGCYSYVIGCPAAGTACVVDPERHVDQYVDYAEQEGVTITAVFDTHVHADHITGSAELSRKTGAPIHIHPAADAAYPHTPLTEGDRFRFGAAELEVVETPGHTPNSVSFAVTDHARSDNVFGLLTGDLLFVGDIGRPDLAGEDLLEEQVKNLYDSLYVKLGRFPDWTEVYPAHGEGSLCGKGMSAKPMTTLGFERRNNPLLNEMPFAKFREIMTASFQLRPSNFVAIVETNRRGPALIGAAVTPRRLSLQEVEAAIADNAVIVDVRTQTAFGAAFIDGSLNIGLASNSVNWLGTVVPAAQDIVLVAESAEDAQAAIWQFQRAGYDRIIGFLENGVSNWAVMGKPLNHLPQISVQALIHVRAKYRDHVILDVRTDAEWESGNIEGARHVPIATLIRDGADSLGLDKQRHITVVCRSGYRANIAGSFLKAAGYEHIFSLIGGMMAWQNAAKG